MKASIPMSIPKLKKFENILPGEVFEYFSVLRLEQTQDARFDRLENIA
jgi:hypothetical protein